MSSNWPDPEELAVMSQMVSVVHVSEGLTTMFNSPPFRSAVVAVIARLLDTDAMPICTSEWAPCVRKVPPLTLINAPLAPTETAPKSWTVTELATTDPSVTDSKPFTLILLACS